MPEHEKSAEELLKSRLANRSREVGQLRLQLLTKQAEINQLLLSHERALQQAVRAKSRLRGLDTKADAVANIAEAALTIRNGKALADSEQQQALFHANKLLDASRQKMQAGDPDAASYLAAKALSLAQPSTPISENRPDDQPKKMETVFASPLDMIVKKRSNVREKASIDSRPLFQLADGAKVKALGYRGLWIRINTKENQEGWIYYYLLKAVGPGAPGE